MIRLNGIGTAMNGTVCWAPAGAGTPTVKTFMGGGIRQSNGGGGMDGTEKMKEIAEEVRGGI